MLVGSRTASVVMLLALAMAGCGKRDLQLGAGGRIDLDGGRDGIGGAGATDAASDGAGGATLPPLDASVLPTDAAESACVTAVVRLPWMKPSSALARLDVATAGDTVAVMNRQPDMLDVRTYTRGGAAIAGFQFAADAQFLPYRDGRFLLVTRGVTGAFSATAIDPDLVGGTRLYGGPATVTEHVLGALPLATSTLLITDERFVNVGGDHAATWSTILGAADAEPFESGRLYGIAAENDRVLIAWGTNDVLRLAVLDTSGALVARTEQAGFFDSVGSYTASAISWGTGLLLSDSKDNRVGGNAIRLTQIGFDLSRTELGGNSQLRTFYRTAPRVAAIALQGQPVAFWLTVFPDTDNSQGFTSHQLYGCLLDLASPSPCLATAAIAATGLGGYGIAEEPVAAAAFSDGAAFAIAHTDVNGRSWLRVATLSCASRPLPPAP
jgi:hypothetical protein